jgi:5-methylcytosine-specific restriction endonuclease McrA
LTKRITGRALQSLRKKVFSHYGDICWLCGQEGADTIDHVIMVSQGGSNTIENLRPAHGRKSAYCVGNYSRRRGRIKLKKKKVKPKIYYEEVGIYY